MGNETAESLRRSWAQYRLEGSGKEGKEKFERSLIERFGKGIRSRTVAAQDNEIHE